MWVAGFRFDSILQEIKGLRTLADLRMYVADTIFEGGVPALVSRKEMAMVL